uniref:Thylakoid membrane protein slr0575 n=1 Tax=Opuntia streptacantha TaxID=393608 RepID=A0A7C9DJ89_OPUST
MPLRAAPAPPICALRNHFLSPNHRHLHHHQLPTTAYVTHLSHASNPRLFPPVVLSGNGLNFVSSKRHRLIFVAEAVDSPSSQPSSNKSIIVEDQFSLSKISFGVLGLGSGITLLAYGFGAYFNVLPGSEWSALMLTYGFPVAVIGMALKYAELKPVPCVTYADAESLREKCATDVLKQVKTDVTRYRYGDEQHLDEALKRIFQYGQGGGIPRRSAPVLQMIREEVTGDGRYCLVLVFEAKALQLSDFERRQAKFASFFGPGIAAEVGKGENNLYEVRLISNTQP